MLNPSANRVIMHLWKKKKKKIFDSHQVLLINPKNGQRELYSPENKNPNCELISEVPRIFLYIHPSYKPNNYWNEYYYFQ